MANIKTYGVFLTEDVMKGSLETSSSSGSKGGNVGKGQPIKHSSLFCCFPGQGVDVYENNQGLNNNNNSNNKHHGKQVILEDYYTIGEEIGKGKFAVVRKGVNKKNNRVVAVKILDKYRKGNTVDNIMKELGICRIMKHPNIVELLDVFDSQEYLFLFMELIEGGELFTRLDKGEKYFTELHAAKLTYEMVSAIQFIHQRDIVHCDLKPENILLTSKNDHACSIKFTDFGLAQRVRGNEGTLTQKAGTPAYVAPEILFGNGYGKPVDMWAVGVITYILLSGFPPFYSRDPLNEKGVYDVIRRADYSFPNPWWLNVSDNAKDFVTQCLKLDPNSRLTASQALQHPWLALAVQGKLDAATLTKALTSKSSSLTATTTATAIATTTTTTTSTTTTTKPTITANGFHKPASLVGLYPTSVAFSSAVRVTLTQYLATYSSSNKGL